MNYGEVGAYLLGRDVGRIFPESDRLLIEALLKNVGQPEDSTLSEALGYSYSAVEALDSELNRLPAFRLGLIDR